MEILLASASPRRREILASGGFSFRVVPSDAEEKRFFSHVSLAALDNAFLKASAVADQYPSCTVIGADTVIELDEKVLGKPGDLPEAFQMLQTLSGRTHLVTTGVAVLCRRSNTEVRFADLAEVQFKPLTGEVIREYLSKVNVLDKAGSYACQEHGEMLIEQIRGDVNTVIGLPSRIFETLRILGKP